jgi:hypothetical protein
MTKILILFLTLFLIVTNVYAELYGKSKKAWEESYLPECIKIQTKSLYNKNYSQSDIKKYCQCVSDHVVERATVNDVNNSTDRMFNIVNDASILCAGKYILSK